MISLRLLTDFTTPTGGRLSVPALKQHLRVDHTEDDQLIEIYLRAAVSLVQDRTGRALLPTTWRLSRDDFPCDLGPIWLPRSPLISITSVVYTSATDGTTVTMPSTDYVATDGEPPSVCPAVGKYWPADVVPFRRSVQTVTFQSGYADSDTCPATLVAAVYLMVGHLYENREAISDMTLKAVPLGFDALCETNRVHWLDYGGEGRGPAWGNYWNDGLGEGR